MSTATQTRPERTGRSGRGISVTAGAASRPQVNLLPPEVHARRALGATKRRLVLVLVLVMGLVVAATAMAIWSERTAAHELAVQQAEVERLLQAQVPYAEVPVVKSRIRDLDGARQDAMGTEVLLADYLLAIQAVTPPGWALTNVTTSLPSPIEVPGLSPNPLAAAGIGQIAFGGRATTVPDIAAWTEALDSVPGFSDTVFTSAEVTEKEGEVFYEVAATVVVDDTLFSHRFTEMQESD